MIPLEKIQEMIAKGYFIVNWNNKYLYAIETIDGVDKYILFKYEEGHFYQV